MTPGADQFAGCLLGLACGDALGAPYEGGPLERLLWRLIGRSSDGRRRWTDDTQMALDLAESLLEAGGVAPDALAHRFAQSYRWSRGYGPGTARVLKRIRRGEPWPSATEAVQRGGSFGNGAAMRAPVLALFFAHDRSALAAAAEASARVTHAHPLGIAGATLIATVTHEVLWGRRGTSALEAARPGMRASLAVLPASVATAGFNDRLDLAAAWLAADARPSPREVARTLGRGSAAPTSCPTAVYIALRHLDRPFEELLGFAIGCGGDVDTIAAMAGALWGAANGPTGLPTGEIEAEARLREVAARLFARQVGA